VSTDNQGCPASRHDRREFLKAAAAVSGVMTATQTLGADGTPKPPNAAPMPQISLGKYSVSRLIVGCHDIDGGGHVSPFLQRETRQYYTPERAVQTLRRCEEVGINAWQSHQRGTLLGIFNRLRQAGGKMQMFGLTNGDENMEEAARVAHHGEVTDRLFKQGKLDVVRDRLKQIRDAGLLVGVSTHMPAVVDAVESKGWDVDYYQTCVYERNRTEDELQKLLGHIPLPREVFLKDDPPRMFKAIRQTKKTCLAFKILAAGRRLDIEQAFKETFAAIKPTDAVIVGIYDRYSDQAGQNAALARRLGCRS
jgi:hypothetical protein